MAKKRAAARSDAVKFDFIVVGSGAGGGPLAARLAELGHQVLVIEAGSNQAEPPRGPAYEVSQVPSFHAVSTEHPDLSWQFFVDHYTNPPSGPDPKRVQDPDHRGRGKIFYPRASALGGCTIHNAMITIAGPDSDWDDLADFLQDESWRGARMRPYFQRLEHNDYTDPPKPPPRTCWGRAWEQIKWLFGFDPDHTRGKHGFKGWLHTSLTDLWLGLSDKQLIKMLKAALAQSKQSGLERAGTLVRTILRGRIRQWLDPNHSRTQSESPEGLVLIPLAVCGDQTTVHQNREEPDVKRGRRSSPRELLLEVKSKHPDKLTIWTDCLVTKVLFDEENPPRAVGVALLKGERLYEAHPEPSEESGEELEVRVTENGEVILCGGAFNTPQLLMLSGIGDQEHLGEHGIDCRRHLPGVGRNLQDRYEVTVISEMKQVFSLLEGATFRLPDSPDSADRHLREWRKTGRGLYTSNGAVLGIFKRSRPDLAQPDLFIFGVPLPFKGYELGYSAVGDQHNFFTWTILKSHTTNYDGTVRLRDDYPRSTPEINFHYFNETTRNDEGANDPDLLAIVDGVKFVRGIADQAKAKLVVRREYHPGLTAVTENNDAQIKDWVRREAWGHHACGTCRMGPDGDDGAVLDSRFRVRGVEGLRVVDASIFPKIPGYFIVTNIYMASEKAADVIHADFHSQPARNPTYPTELRRKEGELLTTRREKVAGDVGHAAAETKDGDWSDDTTGLALSGGGIRSATLCLGILQAMAKRQWLRRVDFLSTVSGGGYIGAFLGRMFDRFRADSLAGPDGTCSEPPPELVERELSNPDSVAVDWLRKHGNYIAPRGHGDWRLGIAAYFRNLLSVHFVVGLLLFALFGLANAFRYGLFDPAAAGIGLVMFSSSDLPLGYLLQALLGPFFSPWFLLFELLFLFIVLPRMVAYWIVSQDRHERFHKVSLSLLFVVGGLLLWLGVRDGLAPQTLALGLALFSVFIPVEMAWRRGRIREQAAGSGGVESQRLRTRNYLTHDLALVFTLAGFALAFALIDTLGHGLQQWVAGNATYAAAFAAIGAMLVALAPVARLVAGLFASVDKPSGPPSTVARIFKEQVIAGLLAALLLLLPLVSYSFVAHAVYQGGSALTAGLAATALAVGLTLLLRWSKAITFVNRSSLSQIYSARLARAFLGASNPLRHRPDGANITEVIAGDDVPSIRDYQPHAVGGPVHLINLVVNQTVDFSSQRSSMDRRGEHLAVSSLGMSIGRRWHSLWANAPNADGRDRPAKRPTRLEPAGYQPGEDHPLISETGEPSNAAEMLSLRQWIAISGAAIGPGRGQNTSLGTALLFGLANLRTGYWWDCGLDESDREGFPRLTFLRRALHLLPKFFLTQSLLLFEWTARFPGPWERYWNLSDGGFSENTGGYELVRRRVPRIILCDGSADPRYESESFAEFVRKVHIDFDANVKPFEKEELERHVPEDLRPFVGRPDDINPDGEQPKHAALFWIDYDAANAPKRRSVLLYLKASVTGDESDDIQNYRDAHPEFPHEATADQVFDESQWESYRKLGQHMASPLCEDQSWFWAIPLEA